MTRKPLTSSEKYVILIFCVVIMIAVAIVSASGLVHSDDGRVANQNFEKQCEAQGGRVTDVDGQISCLILGQVVARRNWS